MKLRKRILFLSAFLLIVILVVGWVSLREMKQRARVASTLMKLQAVANASRGYFSDCGVWPRAISEMTTANNPKQAVYLEFSDPTPKDGWGRPLTYLPFNTNTGFGAVQSRSRDGREILYEVKFGQ